MCQSTVAGSDHLMAQPLQRAVSATSKRAADHESPRLIQRRMAMQGTVDRVVADEGFGFIIGPNGEEYFFHRTALKGVDWEELGPGVPVIFQSTVGEGDRPDEHLRAVDIVLAPDAIPAVDNEPLPPGKVAGGG
jgi:cold shock CspA family protein